MQYVIISISPFLHYISDRRKETQILRWNIFKNKWSDPFLYIEFFDDFEKK